MAFHPPNSLFQYQQIINPGIITFGASVPFGSVFGTSTSASSNFGTSNPYSTSGGVSTSSGPTFGTSAPFSSFNGASTSAGPTFGTSTLFGGLSASAGPAFGNNAYSGGFAAGSSPMFGTSVPFSFSGGASPSVGSVFGNLAPFGVTTSGPTFGTSGAFGFGGPTTSTGSSFGTSVPFGSFSGGSISAGMFGTSSPFSSLNGVSSSVGTTWGSSPFDMSTTVASKPSTNFGIPTPVGFASTSGPTFDTSSAFSFGGPSTSAGPSFCTSVPFSSFNGSSTSAGICGTSAPVSSFNGASSSVGQTTWGPYNPIGTSTTFASKPSTSWTQPSFLDAQRLQVGTSSVFDNNTRGSKVASYTSTREVGNTKILSISAMQVYKDKSHEELRSEDYELLKKPANSPFSTPYPNNFFDTFKRSSFGPTHDQSVNPFPTTTSTFPPKPNPIDSIFRTPVPAPSVNNPTNTSTFLFKPQDSIFKTSISAAPVNPFSFTPNPSTSQPPPFPFPDSNMFKPSVPAPPVNPFLPSTSTFPPQPSPCINPNNSIFNHPGPVNPLFPTTSTFPPQPSPCINPNNSIFNHPGPVNPLFPTTSTFPPLPSPCINPNNSIFNPPGPVNSFYTTSSIFPSQPSPSVLPVPPVNQQPNGQQCIQIQPVVVVNPFASKPTLEVPATRPNQVTPIQYGISSMQAVSKAPSPTSKTTLWRSVRHVSLRQTSSPAHKRNPVNSKNKVTFIFGKNKEGICRSSPFQPRQNPRSWVMSAQTEESPKSQYQNDVEISAMMPKLPEGEEYHIEPSVEELKAKERAEPRFCSRVKNFVVGRRDKGSIRFLGETDIRNLDIGSSVIFNDREVIVNSGDSVGNGLNKPAEVTMLNVNCVTKEKKLVTDGLQLERYKKMLVDKAVENGAEFVSYDPVRGEWKFRVQHFSSSY